MLPGDVPDLIQTPGSRSADLPTHFVLGANLPWLHYGGDFGANQWSPAGGVATRGLPPETRRALESLGAGGVRWLRWFVFCDARAGIQFDTAGLPTGLDDCVRSDIDAALAAAESLGLALVLTLFDFHWFARKAVVKAVQTGGRRQIVARRAGRQALLSCVLEPLFRHVGTHPAIAAWDVINEPEWATLGLGTCDPRRAVRRSVMRRFIGDVSALARLHTGRLVTVGSANARWLDLVRGLDLDFYQVHWYDHMDDRQPLVQPVSTFRLDRPVMLGEFPTRGSRYPPSAIVDAAKRAGYAGCWFWSVQADDTATDRDAALLAFAKPPVTPDDATLGRI